MLTKLLAKLEPKWLQIQQAHGLTDKDVATKVWQKNKLGGNPRLNS